MKKPGKNYELVGNAIVPSGNSGRIAELEELLREGIEGFGRVIVQTSDQASVNDWRWRARKVLNHERR